MRRSILALALGLVAASATGCGKWSQALSVSPKAGIQLGVKAAPGVQADSPEEAAFWEAYPSTATFLTVKSQGLDYLVASFTAKVLGFNRAPALTFPLLIQKQEQFRSCLFLGKDRRVYLSELGTGHASPRFYKIGSVAGKGVGTILTLGQDDAVRLRLDPGYRFEAVVGAPATPGGPAAFELRLHLQAMPPVVPNPNLFTRVPASAASAPAAASQAAPSTGLSAFLARSGAKPVQR